MGFTHNLVKRWVSGRALERGIACLEKQYLGYLPSTLIQLIGMEPLLIYAAFDELSLLLKPIINNKNSMTCILNEKFILIEYVASGKNGAVFKLTLSSPKNEDTISYAFKIYLNDGAKYAELSTGTHFCNRSLKNLARFYFGNAKLGWGIFEFISSTVSSIERKGRRIEEEGFELYDDYPANRVNDVRVDYGRIYPSEGRQPIKAIKTAKDFYWAFKQNPYYVTQTCDDLLTYLPKKERQAVYQQLVEIPSAQKTAVLGIRHLPDRKRFPAYLQVLHEKPELRSEVVRILSTIPKKFRYFAFQDALVYPESRIDLGNIIPHLPKKCRYQVFLQLIEFPESRSSCVSKIVFLYPKDRYKAFIKLLEYSCEFPNFINRQFQWPQQLTWTEYIQALKTDPEFAAFVIRFLPVSIQLKAFKETLDYPQSLAHSVECIPYLPLRHRFKAFNEVFLRPEFRENACKMIAYLTLAEQKCALERYLAYYLDYIKPVHLKHILFL